MRARGTSRRRARIAALAAAIGALWLVGRTADLDAARASLEGLLGQSGLALTLLEEELGGGERQALLETVVLDQLPQAVPEPPEEELTDEETGALPPEETEEPAPAAVPVIRSEPAPEGAMEAPETEETPEEVQEEELFYPVSPEDLELANSTDNIALTLGDYLERDIPLTLSNEGPQILIMHTHGTEAYTIADGDDYTPSDTARTTDENYNMIRVGEEIKAVFEEMGLSVVHDTSLYDYPSYTGSYARSLKGIQSYLEEYPTISVVLDVHRDALIASDGTAYKVTDTMDGETFAQVMLVVGTNDGGLDHPGWEDNLALAARIQAGMLAIHPTFPRPVNLRSQRFNQHMTSGSLLVEVGTSGNTLREALAGARRFAQAAGRVYLDLMQ